MASKVNFDIALTNYNQLTGRFNLAADSTGDVTMDGTQAYAVQTAVGCRRNAWWANPAVGSDVSTLQNLTSRTANQARAMVEEALDPLVQLDLIAEAPSVRQPQAQVGYLNSLEIDVDYTTPGSSIVQRAGFQL